MAYTREYPSDRYKALIQQYSQLHHEGDHTHGIAPESMFPGKSLLLQVARVRELILETGARTILDYGCGKGKQYQIKLSQNDLKYPNIQTYWGVDAIQLYDPCYPPHMKLPKGNFDGVICSDVLEHCPEEDIEWILKGLFAYADKFVFASIACYPAQKTLPNGENAHCTIKPVEWWVALIQRIANQKPDILFKFLLIYKDDTIAESPQKKEVIYTNKERVNPKAALA